MGGRGPENGRQVDGAGDSEIAPGPDAARADGKGLAWHQGEGAGLRQGLAVEHCAETGGDKGEAERSFGGADGEAAGRDFNCRRVQGVAQRAVGGGEEQRVHGARRRDAEPEVAIPPAVLHGHARPRGLDGKRAHADPSSRRAVRSPAASRAAMPAKVVASTASKRRLSPGRTKKLSARSGA